MAATAGFQLFCIEKANNEKKDEKAAVATRSRSRTRAAATAAAGAQAEEHFDFQLLGIKMRSLPKRTVCGMLILGTYSSWICHGYVEERMKHLDFPMMLLTVFQFGSVALFSAINKVLRQNSESSKDKAAKAAGPSVPWYLLLMQTFLVFGSQGISNMANRYLNYPTKIVFKASKLILIMLVGRAFFGKRYHLVEYLATLLLLAGLITINLADASAKSEGQSIIPAFDAGIVFISISLCADAFIGPLQEYTLSLKGARLNDMMLTVYCGACSMALCGLVVEEVTTEGQLGKQMHALVESGNLYPALAAACLFGAISWIGNAFVQSLIQQLGVLLTQTTLLFRQFTTVCISFIVFPNPFLNQHAVGIALVFSGLIVSRAWANRIELHRVAKVELQNWGGKAKATKYA